MDEQLSIGAALSGLLAAGKQVVSVSNSSTSEAPHFGLEVQEELTGLLASLSDFQGYIQRRSEMSAESRMQIFIHHVAIMLAGCMMTIAELGRDLMQEGGLFIYPGELQDKETVKKLQLSRDSLDIMLFFMRNGVTSTKLPQEVINEAATRLLKCLTSMLHVNSTLLYELIAFRFEEQNHSKPQANNQESSSPMDIWEWYGSGEGIYGKKTLEDTRNIVQAIVPVRASDISNFSWYCFTPRPLARPPLPRRDPLVAAAAQALAEADDEFEITLVDMAERPHHIQRKVRPSTTGLEIKKLFIGPPTMTQYLVYAYFNPSNGLSDVRWLPEGKTLHEHRVKPEGKIHLLRPLWGGCDLRKSESDVRCGLSFDEYQSAIAGIGA